MFSEELETGYKNWKVICCVRTTGHTRLLGVYTNLLLGLLAELAATIAAVVRLAERMPNPSLFTCSARHCIGLDCTIEASFCVFGSVEIQHILL